ncbi:MAG: hypothetical protein ACJ77B_05365 [Chloroflexota bacterium]
MDEPATRRTAAPRRAAHSAAAPPPGGSSPAHLADPRAVAILTSEHSSLVTARLLVYNEAFSRASMFLTFLSATLVALGFVSQGGLARNEFLLVAAGLLAFDLFIGLATLGRVSTASIEEFRALQGMNRLRHAYLEMIPSLEPYFTTSRYDDVDSVLAIYGAAPDRPPLLTSFVHGLTTIIGMIGTITAVVGGALAAIIVLLAGGSAIAAIVVGALAVAVLVGLVTTAAMREFGSVDRRLDVRFPSPDSRGDTPTP